MFMVIVVSFHYLPLFKSQLHFLGPVSLESIHHVFPFPLSFTRDEYGILLVDNLFMDCGFF